jgi:hypothetical protein
MRFLQTGPLDPSAPERWRADSPPRSGRRGELRGQLDLRLSKNVRLPAGRVAFNIDLYNALNGSAVQQQNNSFGTWQVPQIIQQSHFAKLSAQVNF